MQWKHLGLNEVTWELEDAMQEAYPFLFNFVSTKDGVIPRGGECNTPVLTLVMCCI